MDLLSAEQIDELERKLRGGAFVTCCTHPDIDRSGYGPEHEMRHCVLDDGNPEGCEMSARSNPNPVTDKMTCEFWQPRQFKRPQRLTIAESLALLAASRLLEGRGGWSKVPPDNNENFWLGWNSKNDYPELWLGTVYHLAKSGHKLYQHMDVDDFTLWQRVHFPTVAFKGFPPTQEDADR